MKNIKTFFCLLASTFVLLACGTDDDDTPKDTVVEDSSSAMRQEFCENFGINSEDYDERLFSVTWGEQMTILSALRKEDNNLLVMAYDTLQGQYVINECSRTFPQSKQLPYYDEMQEYTLQYLFPRIRKVGDGFIALVGLRYISQRGYSDETIGYFHDGVQLISDKIKIGDANADMILWYNNSCLLISQQTICLTNNGEMKWKINERISDINTFPISYENYIVLQNDGGDVEVSRYSIENGDTRTCDWKVNVPFPVEISTNARMAFEVLNLNSHNWRILVIATEQNGTRHQKVLELDVETGVYGWE